MNRKQDVAVVGLGLLGGAFSRRLLSQHWNVRGFDLAPEALERFEQDGGTPCSSLKECIAGSGLLILSLPDSNIARRVLEEVLQICSGQPVAKLSAIVDTTTGDPDSMEANAELARRARIDYYDACVGGSSEEAERGEAIVMVGGNPDCESDCEMLLKDLFQTVFQLPAPGDGARMKLVTNLVLGLTRAALAEGLGLADGLGLDARTTLEILQSGPARSHVMEVKGEKMIERNFKPQARLSQHLKDVRLILETARANDLPVPLSETHENLLSLCNLGGWGNLDNSSVVLRYFMRKNIKLE